MCVDNLNFCCFLILVLNLDLDIIMTYFHNHNKANWFESYQLEIEIFSFLLPWL